MKNLFIPLFILSISLLSNAQEPNNRDVGSAAVLIQNANESGSGFYLQDSIKHFICLVTASHVLINPEKNELYSDSVLLISYKKNSQRDNRDSFKISLASAYKAGMLKYDIQKDVAILKFANENGRALNYLPFVKKTSKSSTYINSLNSKNVKLIKNLITMTDIFTIGYPKSLALINNFDYNRPLIRKGIISGIDLIKSKIITDCPTYQGNSGGMVFEVDAITNEIIVIGIVSQFVPFEEHWINAAYGYANTNIYNSGYTVVVPIDVIIEKIEQLSQ